MKPSSAWSLVTLQFVFIATLVVLPSGALWPRGVLITVIGGVLVSAGVVFGALAGRRLGKTLTPSPIPRDDGQLETTGVYAWARHPIYTALLTLASGLALWGASVGHVVVFALLVVLIGLKARAEEKMLFAKYEAYAAYAARVGRFFPGVGLRTEGK
ncbi:MAG: isoprenylcysteine carboxylmethyltransferase family protein [Pontimonas sp.]